MHGRKGIGGARRVGFEEGGEERAERGIFGGGLVEFGPVLGSPSRLLGPPLESTRGEGCVVRRALGLTH